MKSMNSAFVWDPHKFGRKVFSKVPKGLKSIASFTIINILKIFHFNHLLLYLFPLGFN